MQWPVGCIVRKLHDVGSISVRRRDVPLGRLLLSIAY